MPSDGSPSPLPVAEKKKKSKSKKKSPEPSPSPEPETGLSASWSDASDATLVSALAAAVAAGKKSANGFKPEAWTGVVKALKGTEKKDGGGHKTDKKVRSRWQKVRCAMSGFATPIIRS